jgi:hypothetical protein
MLHTIIASVKVLLFTILLLCSGACLKAQQAFPVPKNLYGIKDPAKAYEKNCGRCKQQLRTKPKEVKFGTFSQDGYLYFIITDSNWYAQFFEKKYDGIALDIIDKNNYVCGGKNTFVNSWAHKGYLLRPMYQKEMNDNAFLLDDGSLVVKYAPLPKGMDPNTLEYNLLLLKNKYLCHYSNFYDLRGEKWQLLEMGLFGDSLTEATSQLQSSLLSKQWRFEIPFEKNKSEYAQTDMKPLYDSLQLNDFYIKSISVKAYSSVEGSLQNNILLQERRAQSIVQALQSFQIETIQAQVSASENWVEFLEDLSATRHASLKNLSKEEIKERLESKQLSAELEPYLSKHRKAILLIDLEKKVKYTNEAPEQLKQTFSNFVQQQNLRDALEIQQEVFAKVKAQQLPESFVKELTIPAKAEFGLLLQNKIVFDSQNEQTNIQTSLQELSELLEIMPNDRRLRYNYCVLQLQAMATGKATMDATALYAAIQDLGKKGIAPLLVKRLLINYHIIQSEAYMSVRNYAEKDKSVRYIYNNYATLQLSDHDVLNLSKYFVAYHKYDWAEKILAKNALHIDVDEDLLFYYLNLTIAESKSLNSKHYRSIMLNAINMNKERFCNLFKPFGKGGISFQLLDHEYLKKTYCENCKE